MTNRQIHKQAYVLYSRPFRWWNPDTWFNGFQRVKLEEVQQDVYLLKFKAPFEMRTHYISYDYTLDEGTVIKNVNTLRKVDYWLAKHDNLKVDITFHG